MAAPLVKAEEREEIIRNLNTTVSPVAFTFRGEWMPGVAYKKNDYIYSHNFPGYLYVATTDGTSQSDKEGKTGELEPAWSMLSSFVYDGALQFVPTEVTEEVATTVKRWKPGIILKRGELIAPSSGPSIILGQSKQYYVYKVNKLITNIDWPRTPREYIKDNDITWECRISYGKLLPPARLQEPMYKELVEVMDFLNLHEEIFFDDLTYKFADQMRVRNTSIKEVIAEFGYSYITDFIGLTDKELQSALAYISLIHYLKGSESGLSLVFELLGVNARWQEWWEEEPKGIPDTWKLWVDMDVSKASGYLAERIISFTRQYVYPIMQEFEVSYKVNLINLAIGIAGFLNAEYQFSLTPGLFVLQGIGTYIDRDYSFKLEGRVRSVLGRQTPYADNDDGSEFVGQVFGFHSIYGNVGTWGSIWMKYESGRQERQPYAGEPGGSLVTNETTSVKESITIISEEEAKKLVMFYADEKREGD